MASTSPILWNIVEEHLDEAEFLFEQWCRAAVAPDYTWRDARRTWGERLDAHLDGLLIAGEPATDRLLLPAVADDDVDLYRAAAAALVLLESPGDEGVRRVLEALSTTEPGAERHAGLERALESSSRAGLDAALRDAAYRTEGPLQWRLVKVLSLRGVDAGPIVGPLLRMQDPRAQEAGLRAVVLRGEDSLWPLVDALLDAQDRSVRAAAVEAAMTWGRWAGWCRCVEASRLGDPDALGWVGMLGGRECVEELAFIADAVEAMPTRHAALRALGYTGDRRAAEVCLQWMRHDDSKTAAVAADAFGAITGVDAFGEGFGTKSAGESSVTEGELPLQEDLAVDLTPGDDDELPTPVASRFTRWWDAHGTTLENARRYVRGVPAGGVRMHSAMEAWPLRCGQWLRRVARARSHGAVGAPGPRVGGASPWHALEEVTESMLQRTVAWR